MESTERNQIVCEQRCDEGIRFFQDECCGTIRTIDGGGDKRVLEQIIVAYENHEISERRGNMTKPELRTDGLSNTITTVLKDNTLFEMTEETELQEIRAIDEQNMAVRHETFGALTTERRQ